MSKVTYRKEGNIAILGIDRPEALNALSREIVDGIGSTIEQIKSERDKLAKEVRKMETKLKNSREILFLNSLEGRCASLEND